MQNEASGRRMQSRLPLGCRVNNLFGEYKIMCSLCNYLIIFISSWITLHVKIKIN